MSTANKLSYLNDTKSLLRTSLNKFGSSILSTDTFRSYDTKLNEIYDKLPKVTATGQGLTISNVQNGLLDDFKMNGVDLEQNTTNGNQLIDFGNVTTDNPNITWSFNNNILQLTGESGTYVGIQYDVSSIIKNSNNSGKTIKFGYKTISNITGVGSIVQLNTYYNDGTANQYLSLVNREGTLMSTYTIPNDTSNIKYAYLVIYTNNNYQASTGSVTIEEPLVYFDNNNTYEPYTGGIPSPNPDYPQEIKVVEGRQVINVKGKNLFDKNNANILRGFLADNGTFNATTGYKTLYISCNNFSTYTIQKTSGSFFRVAEFENIPANGDNWITRTKDDNANVITFTTTTGNYLAVAYFRSSDTVTEQEMLNSIQIEEGSTATNYEPYYEPVSYNINLHGKNEFDGEYEDGYYNMNGTKSSTQDPYGRRSTNLNKIEPNTNYSISINNNIISETIRLFYYDANRGFISTESISNGTFTTPAECYYVSWHSSSLKQNYPDGIPNMMIEQGQTVTTYEDYYDYKLAKIPNTDYKNRIYKNNGNWYFEENVKKVVLDGSDNEDWANHLKTKILSISRDHTFIIMCNYFKPTTNSSWVSNDDSYRGMCSSLNTVGQIKFMPLEDMTLNEFKTWLSTHNVEVWCQLDNPVTTQITNTTLINQLEAISVYTGTNIITISNDNNIIPEIEITRLKELEKLS